MDPYSYNELRLLKEDCIFYRDFADKERALRHKAEKELDEVSQALAVVGSGHQITPEMWRRAYLDRRATVIIDPETGYRVITYRRYIHEYRDK